MRRGEVNTGRVYYQRGDPAQFIYIQREAIKVRWMSEYSQIIWSFILFSSPLDLCFLHPPRVAATRYAAHTETASRARERTTDLLSHKNLDLKGFSGKN